MNRYADHIARDLICIGLALLLGMRECLASDWMPMRNETGTFAVPRLAFIDIARLPPGMRTQVDLAPLNDERWVTTTQIEAGMLGLDAQHFASTIRQLRTAQTLLIGRYSPQVAELSVQVLRVERRRDGSIYVSTAPFTPHHGELWRAYGQFRTAMERAQRLPGYNPFEVHRGQTDDPVFHQVSAAAAQVAMGQAMRQAGALTGWLAVSDHRLVTSSQTSSGLFRRTVRWTIDGLVKPRWMLLTPLAMAPLGAVSALTCASPAHVVSQSKAGLLMTDCDDPAHRVASGVWATQWSGGNLPSDEQTIMHAEGSQSGLTLLAQALIVGAVVFAAASAASMAAGSGADNIAGGMGLAADLTTTGTQSGPPSGLAAATGLLGSGSALLSGEVALGRQITQTFSGLIDAGLGSAMPAPDAYSAQLFAAIGSLLVRAPLSATLAGVTRLATGNCDPALSANDCQKLGLAPGSVPRIDSLVTSRDVSLLHRAGRACAALGLTGAAWRQCTAPERAGVFDGN